MATSLMNDSSYAYEIQRDLISAAEVLFRAIGVQGHLLSLDEEDFSKQVVIKREEILNRLRQEEARIDAITGRQGSAETNQV